MSSSSSSFFRDLTYAGRLAHRLDAFKKKGNNTFNFRCPICGDSEKNSRKARGYIFPGNKKHSDTLFFKCYNCNASMSFEKFLAQIDAALYSDYRLGRFTDTANNIGLGAETSKPKTTESVRTKPLFSKDDLGRFCSKIESLPRNHVASQYLIQRKIPDKSDLFYTADFRKMVLDITEQHQTGATLSKESMEKMRKDDARVIIPFVDRTGNVIGFQGRALDPNNKVKYITIKLDAYAPKVYGLDKVDLASDTIYVFEGPFDSMFIPNSIAVMDSNLSNVGALLPDVPKEKFVLVWDNEPRNPAIVSNMQKGIKSKFRIVIFSPNPGDAYEKNKDVNAIVCQGGILPSAIQNTLDTLTYSTRSAGEAMMAELHFNQWKKINS